MIRWIRPFLGTSAVTSLTLEPGQYLLDVRDLVDKSGNTSESINLKIQEGLAILNQGNVVIVGCDYGISRSNAIAAGILCIFKNISFENAVRTVIEATGENEIKLGPLNTVQKAIEGEKQINTSKTRILLTGCSGFIGTALWPVLKNKWTSFSLSRNDLDLRLGAVQLDLFVKKLGITHIIHLANPRIYTSNSAIGETLTILRNIVEVSISNNLHLIYPSNWEVYSGYVSTGLWANEQLIPKPKGLYGETKMLCEFLLEHCRDNYNLKYTLLRSSPIYGINPDRPKFIWTYIECAMKGKPIYTHQYKNGFPGLDLLYVDDFCEAICSVINQGFAGNFNIGTGQLHTTRETAIMIRDKLKSLSDIRIQEIDEYAPNIAMDTALARKVLSWNPKTSFENGFEKIIFGLSNNNILRD